MAMAAGSVPNIRQNLYSDLVVALALEPEAALSPENDKDSMPAARRLPQTWDEVGPGHFVIAQESLEYGWWEAIVLELIDEVYMLPLPDFLQLPKFFRHRCTIS